MRWPSWDQAAIATLVLALLTVAGRRSRSARLAGATAAAGEAALVASLYTLWRLARQLPLVRDVGAYERGRQIWDLERALRLPSELAIERWVIAHTWIAEATVLYYATMHVPGLLIFLVWLWVRHRERYPRWRNVLAITTGLCLFLRFVRVAPPRLLPELGFVDLAAQLGRDVYGPVGTGASDQLAAMPSIHVAWAAIVGIGAWSVGGSRWRWLGPAHLALTCWAVVATANHWWLDGVVAVAFVLVAMAVDEGVRRAWRSRRPEPGEAPVVAAAIS